jgi:hypothetical protein
MSSSAPIAVRAARSGSEMEMTKACGTCGKVYWAKAGHKCTGRPGR